MRSAGDQYVWGFSLPWLIITCSLTAAWLFGLWIMWVDADRNSQFCHRGRRMGYYRAALDVAEALNEELGPDTGAYSNAEIQKRVGGLSRFKYFVEPDEARHGVAKIGLSTRPSAQVRLDEDKKYA